MKVYATYNVFRVVNVPIEAKSLEEALELARKLPVTSAIKIPKHYEEIDGNLELTGVFI